MSFKREWAIGSWSNRATLSYTDIDRAIVKDGNTWYCDTYGRMVNQPQMGDVRPVINFDDSTNNVWYISFSTNITQAVIKVSFN